MAKIFHAHLYGNREAKYDRLLESSISKTIWSELLLQTPSYLLIPQDTQLLTEYEMGWKVTEILPVNSVGIVTGQDSETIAFEKKDARLLAKKHQLSESVVTQILYRPFDLRFAVYDPKVVTRPRTEVMQHMMPGGNMALVFMRQVALQDDYTQFGVAECLVDNRAFYSNKGIMSMAPLYLVEGQDGLLQDRKPNLSQPFLNAITDRLSYTPTPEAIFYYIYAIFHSPTYRTRYAEFLKIDFPRVPLTCDDDLFCQLAAYGEELVALHLMKSARLEETSQLPTFVEQGGKRIVDPAHPKYDLTTHSVIINKKGDRFTRVPEEVWNFYVGGYPVCAKWLKDRKGRTLNQEDITHYQRIVVALQETIRLMQQIDEAIPGFPIV